ncbi:MAG TPA: metal ABC transporter ATP-binding protein [Thermotogaceae bacterium]|nr:metal ABC transporter ATP-binding protein [Thermotogota bacterium]HEW91846.1 metal ABC transporter ATP-binding protein [Thermotogaceae bacterium]
MKEKIVEVMNVNYSKNDVEILKNINFEIFCGDFVGIIGPNGAGKTTLAKIIVGDIKDYSGKVIVRGKIGYVPQMKDINRDIPILVREFASMGLYEKRGLFRFFTKEDWKEIERNLEMVGIIKLKDRPITKLSGGELQRLMLARALLYNPDILILDEPEAGVDQMGKARFYELIDTLRNDKNLTVILISHDIGMIFQKCEKIMCLNKTLHCQAPRERISLENLQEVFSEDFDIWIRGQKHYEREHKS